MLSESVSELRRFGETMSEIEFGTIIPRVLRVMSWCFRIGVPEYLVADVVERVANL